MEERRSKDKALNEPSLPLTKEDKVSKEIQKEKKARRLSRIWKTIAHGLEKIALPLSPPPERSTAALINWARYKWITQACWLSNDWRRSSPAEILIRTFYEEIPPPRRYDAPPPKWPSMSDMDPRVGQILRRRYLETDTILWVRYMKCYEKTCSACCASFWSVLCPACGSDQWASSACSLIEVMHPSLSYLAKLDIGKLRKTYYPAQ